MKQMSQIYSVLSRENDPYALPDAETFYLHDLPNADLIREGYAPGWYWWLRWPGCLADGDPCGPFDTEDEAVADAQADSGQFEPEDEEAEGAA